MSEIKPVSPEEAAELLEGGWVYVDVRSEPEFEAGHVPGALNVPLMNMGPGGMTPNPEFLSVIGPPERQPTMSFSSLPNARSRFRRAADMLHRAGFSNLCDLYTGWEGSRDAFGRAVPGWATKGMPVEPGKPDHQRYEDVKSRQPK